MRRLALVLGLLALSSALPVRDAPHRHADSHASHRQGGQGLHAPSSGGAIPGAAAGSIGEEALGAPGGKGVVAWKDVNILQLTDVHSWLSGHQHEKGMGADYADVLSFYQHMKAMADLEGKDLWLFNSGDIVEGTGLSDATKTPGELILPIIATMPFDAITCGNHELYHNETIKNLQSGFIASWDGRYLTGNIRDASTGEPLGSQYAVLTGKHGKRLLVFGFLYNMMESCGAVTVDMVQDIVKATWFKTAVAIEGNTTHAIVLLTHMDVKDPLVTVLRNAIRALQPHTPVVFLTGHTHYRGYKEHDPRCASMESGCYLDTIGLLQFDLPYEDTLPVAFNHTFITPNVDTFMDITQTTKKNFDTPEAKVMKAAIAQVRAQTGIDKLVGCSDMTYYHDSPLKAPDSLWSLYMEKVLPQQVFAPDTGRQVYVGHTGIFRYNLFEGKVTIDDTYIVSPFKDKYMIARKIPGNVLAVALKRITAAKRDPARARSNAPLHFIPEWVSSMASDEIDVSLKYDVICVSYDSAFAEEKLKEAGAADVAMVPFRDDDCDDRVVWERFIAQNWPCKKT